MGSFQKECSDLLNMSGRDALRLKEEIQVQQKQKAASDHISLISQRMRSKEISKNLRKRLFD